MPDSPSDRAPPTAIIYVVWFPIGHLTSKTYAATALSPLNADMATQGTEKAVLDIEKKRLLLFSPQEKQFLC